MGRIPTKIPIHALKMIRSRQREVMRRLAAGQSHTQICSDMGYSQSRLSVIANSPLFKRELEKMRREIDARTIDDTAAYEAHLRKLKPKALNVIADIMQSVDKAIPLRLKRDCAKDVLEIAGATKKAYDEGMNDFARFIAQGFELAMRERQLRLLQQQKDSDKDKNKDTITITINKDDVVAINSDESEERVMVNSARP